MKISGILAIGLVIVSCQLSKAGEPPISLPAPNVAPAPVVPLPSPTDCSDCRQGESHFRHFLATSRHFSPVFIAPYYMKVLPPCGSGRGSGHAACLGSGGGSGDFRG